MAQPTSVQLPEAQVQALTALVGSGAYTTQSEIMRQALEEFFQRAPRATRLAAAIWAYQKGKLSLSQAARLAGLEHEEMHRTLVREGLFESGETAESIQEGSDYLSQHARKPAKKAK